MSGTKHNKEESCEGCPDRSIEPNCHDTCEGIKIRQERQAAIKREQRKVTDYVVYKSDRVLDAKKKSHKRT